MNDIAGNNQAVDSRQSNTFRDSFEQIIEWMRHRLFTETNVNHLLAIAQFYGTFRLLNFDGVYQDNDIEDLVELRVIQSSKLALPDMSKTNPDTVLIASNLANYGGHSRVVLNWLAAFKEESNHRLLITQTVSDTFRSKLECQGISFHLCTNQGIELVNEIERVVLHINPSDIVAAVAARILAKSGKRIIFYNHADHRFSFGISSAHLVCEVSNYGIELNRRARRLKDSCYLGIPICFQGHRTGKEMAMENKLNKTVLSAGDSYKYAPGTVFFGSFIDDLLQQRSDVTFLLVGPTGNEPWWIKVRERWCNRIHFLGQLSHSEYLDTMQKADVYVDSFPITGGTAFPEALLNGKAVAGLHSPLEGYSPVDELRVGDVRTLTRQVINLLNSDPISIRRIEEIREKAVAIHSITEFRERVRRIYSCCYDRNVGNKVDVDTYWLEKRWTHNAEIYLPGRIMPTRVPLKFCVSFKSRADRLLGPLVQKYRGYITLGIIFRLLPANTKEYVKDMHYRLRSLLSKSSVNGAL
jgi:glycosyltransferase involved in cell wall biosynthesis